MYPGLRDTPQNKTTPALRPSPHLLPPPTAPAGCGVICGGRRPATAPQTSSGTWGERGRSQGPGEEGSPRERGGGGGLAGGAGASSQLSAGAAVQGSPGPRGRKGRPPASPERSPLSPPPLWVHGLPPGCPPPGTHAPSPDDVLQGPQQRLLLVLDAMLGAQRPHQRGHLVEVVPGHRGEEAGGGPRVSGQGPGRPACSSPCAHPGGRHAGGAARGPAVCALGTGS